MGSYELKEEEMYRTCNKCGQYKPISEFSFLKTGRYCIRCKDCNYNDYVKKNKSKNYFTVSKYSNGIKEEPKGLPKWILRNLNNFGNCCIKKTTYEKYEDELKLIAYIDEGVDLDNCYKIKKL